MGGRWCCGILLKTFSAHSSASNLTFMTREELELERQRRWRTDAPERGIRTIEDARAFIEEAGFALMFPVKPAVTAPTFLGAYAGSADGLPTRKDAYRD